MKRFASALVRACLVTTMPIAAWAQTQPVIIEAEAGTLGANLAINTLEGATYVATTVNRTTPPAAPDIGTYSVTFPAAGNYELYARIRVGPGGAIDDSFYFGQGFGEKQPENGGQWALWNDPTAGHRNPGDTVVIGGNGGFPFFKWIKITGAAGPGTWTVPADALTQTFQWGTREDGLFMDKLAFGRAGICYTVADLDAGRSASGACPPPPPPDPPPHTRTDPPLAAGKDKFLGSAWSPGIASTQFASYWNQVTQENGGKWGVVEPVRDDMRWADADAAYALAKANGFPFKWHTLIWGGQQPQWIAALPPEEQRAEIEEWFAAIAERYPDIDQIDVVNEPLHQTPRAPTAGGYIEALGGDGVTGWDWVITSFELARRYFPNAELILNDFSITNDGNATTTYLQIIQLLKDRGLIDAIGDQGHAFSTTEAAPMPNHRRNLDRLAATGLPIYITELDLDGVLQGVIHHETQLANYQRVFPVFWEHPAVKGITVWGYVRGSHWRNAQGDWLLYQNGGERPALQWLIRYVGNTPATVTAGQVFELSEATAAGSIVGNVLATDPEADTVLSQWQLTDPSGTFVIDGATGTLSLAPGATLDFEGAASYVVNVSVWDGFMRSAPAAVTIRVTNENDNTPEILPGQTFDIDDGADHVIGALAATDADDTNQIGYTAFGAWTITGGNTGSVFRLRATTGHLEIARPLAIDWRRTSYALTATVSDGAHTSAAEPFTVVIPRRVNMCLLDAIKLEVPKATAPLVLLLGGELGGCGGAP
jgi:endo-1,4-beta-xylanase